MLRRQIAGQLLGEVLHHVVAFGLAVHQDVDPGLLLEGQDVPDLVLDALLVPGGVDPAGPHVGPGGAQFVGLRERADGRGRQQREPEVRALGEGPLGVRLRAPPVGVGDGRGTGPYRGVAGQFRPGAGGQIGAVGGEFGSDGIGAPCQTARQDGDLLRLLPGEREPAGDLRIDVALGVCVQRYVQERAGRRDVDPVRETEEGAQRGQ